MIAMFDFVSEEMGEELYALFLLRLEEKSQIMKINEQEEKNRKLQNVSSPKVPGEGRFLPKIRG